MILATLEDMARPKHELEQWTTPPEIASSMLIYAYECGDIEGKVCADFGCGNGILAIGMGLLGARRVIAIEIDSDALGVASRNKRKIEDMYCLPPIQFIHADVRRVKLRCDTILMNPPFGVERETRHADRYFLSKAFECSDVIYSLHYSSEASRRFILSLANEYGFSGEVIATFRFPLRMRFWFHRRHVKSICVDFYVFRKV